MKTIDKEFPEVYYQKEMRKIVLALISLLMGGLIYLSWRPQTLVMFSWFDNMCLGGFVARVRNSAGVFPSCLPKWVLFSLPSGLWTFAGVLILASIWGNRLSAGAKFWISVFLLMALAGEVGQAAKVVPGVFGWGDMTAMAIAGLAGLFAAVHV